MSSPYDEANIFGRLFYIWLTPVLKLGNKQYLEQYDLVKLSKYFKAEYLLEILSKNWLKEQSRKKPSLTRAMIKTFWLQSFIPVFLLLIVEACVLSQTYLLGELLTNLKSIEDEESKNKCILYTAIMCITIVIAWLARDPFFFSAHQMGIWTKVSSSALIYNKILKLNQQSFAKTTTGQIINLLTNDVRRLETAFIFMHYLWLGPILTLLVLYLLYVRIGVASFAGVAALILLSPLQALIGRFFAQIRHKTALLTDERVKLVSEIVNGIRIVKMYCWENLFRKHVDEVRRREMRNTNRYLYLQSVTLSQWLYQHKIATLLSIGIFLMNNEPIDAPTVFATVAYLSYLRVVIILFVPMGITGSYEARVAFNRIKNFLLLPELDQNKENVVAAPISNHIHVTFDNFGASWEAREKMKTLKNINFSLTGPCLMAVTGPVGAGKSSLLMAILEELGSSNGSVRHNGLIAYSAQQAWVFSDSIKENILFGKEYDDKFYNQVLEATTLDKDILDLPDGDQTLVGERGVSLSGGQRARVSLARAVYADRDIVLLDDPFSAVDTKVGKQIFDKCVRTLLREKLVIFVTHQSRFLHQVDRVIVLDQGEIIKEDSFDNLIKVRDFDLEELLTKPANVTNQLNSNTSHASINLLASMESLSDMAKDGLHEDLKVDLTPLKLKGSNIEARETGSISGKIYLDYIAVSGQWLFAFILAVLFLTTIFIFVLSDWWLAYWTDSVSQMKPNGTLNLIENGTSNSTQFDDSDSLYFFSIYGYLCLGIVILALLRMFCFFKFCMQISRKMHNLMLQSLLSAPVRFFDTTAAGKILNRFSKDVGIMDDMIPLTTADFLQCFGIVLGILASSFITVPYIILVTIPLLIAFYFLRRYYMKPSQEIKRLEAVARSPVFSHVTNTIQGLGTVRAWNGQERFMNDYFKYQNDQTNCTFHFVSSSRWFAQRLEIICTLFISSVLVAVLLSAIYGSMHPGIAGFAITYVIGLFALFQWTVRQSTEVQNHFVSVERILEYTKLEKEPPYESSDDCKPPSDWPSRGRIEFKDFSLFYTEDSPPALKSINVLIHSGEKIGIVGRTGAGKSSLIVALFRMAKSEGSILIDGVDTSKLGLFDLRQNISIIPQDPMLFAGTIRRNLDPFNQVSDEQIWRALEEVQLKRDISNLSGGLQNNVSEGGTNLSVGQRQLLCLARALLRHNKILLIDEATANVDPKTDNLIQKTIRTKFHNCTVLTIAHRLHTIMDSDRVMVMSHGGLCECDSPHILLSRGKGVFHHLVQQTTPPDKAELYEMARDSYLSRKTTIKKCEEQKISSNQNHCDVTDVNICLNGISESSPMLQPDNHIV